MLIWVIGADGLLGKTVPGDIRSNKEQADITNIASLRSFAVKNPGITHLVNASAYSLVDLAETNRNVAFQVNALGPENLGRIANEIGAKVIHISTDYVFPGNIFRPLSEEDQTCPVNYYGETKLEGEQRLLSIAPHSCVIRTSALFGKGGKNFIAKLLQMFQEKEEIFLANDQVNSPTFANDLCDAIFHLLNHSGIYHFSNQGEATKFDFGQEIYQFAKSKGIKLKTKSIHSVPSSLFPSACKRPVYSVFDTGKMQKDFAIRDWRSALHSFLESV
ncbi:MAG TPA: dTDP-4-dehydrorhamnose reductase [Chlamydiales bacterium]|nr:dTDP-4-dehydrorhamnose reductase [Chlamydiales bacterium]